MFRLLRTCIERHSIKTGNYEPAHGNVDCTLKVPSSSNEIFVNGFNARKCENVSVFKLE